MSLTSSTPYVADAFGNYYRAKPQQILACARTVLDELAPTGAVFSKPAKVRDYLTLKLAGYEHEILAALFSRRGTSSSNTPSCFAAIDGAYVHTREVVKAALAVNAAAVIFAHNHPSGSAEPSAANGDVTAELTSAIKLIDVRVLDYIVASGAQAVSLSERGLM